MNPLKLTLTNVMRDLNAKNLKKLSLGERRNLELGKIPGKGWKPGTQSQNNGN